MKDSTGKLIEPGQRIERIVNGNAALKGFKANIMQYDWSTGGVGEDLIADFGFLKELIDLERAKEYRII